MITVFFVIHLVYRLIQQQECYRLINSYFRKKGSHEGQSTFYENNHCECVHSTTNYQTIALCHSFFHHSCDGLSFEKNPSACI